MWGEGGWEKCFLKKAFFSSQLLGKLFLNIIAKEKLPKDGGNSVKIPKFGIK